MDVTERDDEFVDLLRNMLAAKANELVITPRSLVERSLTDGRRRRPVQLAVAAAAVVMAGAGGIILTTRDVRDNADETVVTVPSVDDLVAALAASDPAAPQVQWYLPTVLPPGYELVDIQASVLQLAESTEPGDSVPTTVNTQQWELAEDGRTVALVTAMAWPGNATVATYHPNGIPPGVTTGWVHGNEATVRVDGVPTVMWVEDGSSFTLQGAGALTSDDLLALAEASAVRAGVIDLGVAAVDGGLLAGYSLVSTYDSGDDHAGDQYVRLTLEAADGDSQVAVEVAPADAYSTDPADETRLVNGVEYLIVESPPVGRLAARRTVSAVIDDRMVIANGPIPADQLVAIAAGLRAATAPDAALAAHQTSLRAATLPVRGSVTFANGVTASVHTAPNGSVVLCVQQPVTQCRWDASAEIIGDEALPLRYEVFNVNGQRHAVGWYGGTSDVVVDDDQPHEIIAATTGSGQFISARLANDDEPPTIAFPDDPNILGAGAVDVIHP